MFKFQSTASLISSFLGEDGRDVFILDSTILHPQGGGQPSDTGFITNSQFKFLVPDVRSKSGIVYHYGMFEKITEDIECCVEVLVSVDESKRKLNSRLHSAGHLLDACLEKVGLSHLESSKAYHFPDGPYVEYKDSVPQTELQSKQKELKFEANNLISKGVKVSVAVYPYEEASELCGGGLPSYIPKGSTPCIVKLGDFPGCPCGGTHVSDILDLVNIKTEMMREKSILDPGGEMEVSFGYQCTTTDGYDIPSGKALERNNSSFSCLSGAAISANATLANTNICNGLISSEILPSLDSPKSFRRIPSSPSFTKLDLLSSSFQSSMSYLSCSPSTTPENLEFDSFLSRPLSAPSRNEDFLTADEVQVAGGAAGEDRVQAVCSEENGWLFCAIYDGFNGRDAADFLAGTFYETIRCNLNSLDIEFDYFHGDGNMVRPKNRVLDSLQRALNQAESDFLHMVEQEMEDRPDIVSVGSCVLVGLLQGKDLYIMNLGDSRAVLATDDDERKIEVLKAVQLTDSHTVDNEVERNQVVSQHPDDPKTIVHGKVKGKLKVTRAFGVGYLKKKVLNDALMGILRVRNLLSPPYVSVEPSLYMHEVSSSDHFVILGSDGLFDFFTNDEAVKLVHSYISTKPSGDPAKYLLEQLVLKAACSAGFSTEELMSVPAGRRRKYHDDVTVIVIILGTNKRTSKASTCI